MNTLRLPGLLGTAVQSLGSRRFRAGLSALGIAMGIGAMVAVVGVSDSARANLIAEIDALGTNLLTVTPGTTVLGKDAALPTTSVPMIRHIAGVRAAAATTSSRNRRPIGTHTCPASRQAASASPPRPTTSRTSWAPE